MDHDDVFTSNFMSGPRLRHESNQNLISQSSSDRSSIGGVSDVMYESIQTPATSVSHGINGANHIGRSTAEAEPLFDAATAADGGKAAARGKAIRSKVDKLKATNTRLNCVFYLVAGLCVVLMVVYIVVIVSFIIMMQQLQQPKTSSSSTTFFSSPSSSSSWTARSSGVPFENCVKSDSMREFLRFWDRGDDSHITDYYNRSFTIVGQKVCFHSLHWLPLLMSKMNSSVSDAVKVIEDRQEIINQTVNKYLVNWTGNAEETNTATGRQSSRNDAFAHFFLDRKPPKPGTGDVLSPLFWEWENVGQSRKWRTDVTPMLGKFKIRHAGFYFLYARVHLKNYTKNATVVVMKKGKENTILLSSSSGPASLQGTFRLHVGDELWVEAIRNNVYVGRSRSTYFGIYLICT